MTFYVTGIPPRKFTSKVHRYSGTLTGERAGSAPTWACACLSRVVRSRPMRDHRLYLPSMRMRHQCQDRPVGGRWEGIARSSGPADRPRPEGKTVARNRGKSMVRRLIVLSSVFLLFTLGVAGASPARAATVQGCRTYAGTIKYTSLGVDIYSIWEQATWCWTPTGKFTNSSGTLTGPGTIQWTRGFHVYAPGFSWCKWQASTHTHGVGGNGIAWATWYSKGCFQTGSLLYYYPSITMTVWAEATANVVCVGYRWDGDNSQGCTQGA